MLIDSHCHIDFYDKQKQQEIIDNAINSGVNYMLNAASSKDSFEKIINLTEKYENVFGAIGIHPHNAEDYLITEEELVSNINKSKKIIAIGETGLDYSGDNVNKDIQIKNFITHINVSQKTSLPLIIHNRDSNDDMIDILSDQMKKQKFKAILHCFTADFKMAKSLIEMNILISASGIVTFKNSVDLQNVFKEIPLDKILVETDSPYLAPTPYRGKENKPEYVVEVAKKIAEIKACSFDEVSNITTTNFKNLFNLDLK